MSELKITIFGVEHTLKVLEGAAHRIAHLEPVWEDIATDLMSLETKVFASEGGAIGVTWPALSPAYARWKARHGFSQKILERTGELRRSLTEKSSGDMVLEITPDSLAFGTALMVGSWFLGTLHQEGTRRMPARPIMPESEQQLPAGTVPRWLNWIGKYVVGEEA